MSKERVVSQLKDLAKLAGQNFVFDVIEFVEDGKAPRLEQLAVELSELKIEALSAEDPDTRLLYGEMIEDKLGSMAHVLNSERIVANKRVGAMLTTGLKTMLGGFVTIAEPIIKASISGVVGGVLGGVLGDLGDKLVDKGIDAVIDKLSPE